jgi:homoserine O-acetyltransferase/O-succinyltransferase
MKAKRKRIVPVLMGIVLGILPSSGGFSQAAAPTMEQAGPHESDASFADYKFRDGETIPQLRIHYVTLGTAHRNNEGEIDNAVLVLHWTGADGRDLLSPSYRKALFDEGRPLDSRRYYLIIPDNVGHGQSSKPSDGLKARFPNYGYGDIVDLQHKLVMETLGIKHLHAILGMSMGGMNAWQWAEAYPTEIDGIMPVVSLPVKVSGRNLLWRRMVIEDIRSDPMWNNGNYTKTPQGLVHGYELVRLMIDGVPHFQATLADTAAVNQFLNQVHHQADKVDANDLLYSLKSSTDYDPEPHLSSIQTKVFALNFSDDEFNPEELHILEHQITKVPRAQFIVQDGSGTSYGHFTMAHPELWADHVADFMRLIARPIR